MLRPRHYTQQSPGAPLLHDDRLQRNIQRAELHQPLRRIGQHLRIQIVDIGFDHRYR